MTKSNGEEMSGDVVWSGETDGCNMVLVELHIHKILSCQYRRVPAHLPLAVVQVNCNVNQSGFLNVSYGKPAILVP